MTSLLSVSTFGLPSLAPPGVGGANGKAIDVRTVERRRIDRGDHIMGEHARARLGKRYRLGWERRELEMSLEARARFFRRHNLKKLLLPRGGAHTRDQIASRARPRLSGFAHVATLMATVLSERMSRGISFAVGRHQYPSIRSSKRR